MKYRKRIVKSVQLETWSSAEVKTHLQLDNRLAIVPVGSFEQHGPHAPLGTDTFISVEVSYRLAQRLGAVVVPPVWFGISDEHMDFAGTITVSPDTLCNLMADIVISLKAGGFNDILILNGHAGNEPHLSCVRDMVTQKSGQEINLLIKSYWEELPEGEKKKLSSLEWGLHANEFETSVIAAILPATVKKIKDTGNFPDMSTLNGQDMNEKVFKNLIKNSNGVWGDPTRASIKRGRALLAQIELTLTNYLAKELKLSNSDCAFEMEKPKMKNPETDQVNVYSGGCGGI